MKTVKMDCIGDDVFFNDANVHIRNGESRTDSRNGTGNLIIGYNETGGAGGRTGSHNVILGTQNSYESYGGIVAGQNNTISAPYASVLGGSWSVAGADLSCILGGSGNTASGNSATISGGGSNTASGVASTVGGGYTQTANVAYQFKP